jgi:hypothetical protein
MGMIAFLILDWYAEKKGKGHPPLIHESKSFNASLARPKHDYLCGLVSMESPVAWPSSTHSSMLTLIFQVIASLWAGALFPINHTSLSYPTPLSSNGPGN